MCSPSKYTFLKATTHILIPCITFHIHCCSKTDTKMKTYWKRSTKTLSFIPQTLKPWRTLAALTAWLPRLFSKTWQYFSKAMLQHLKIKPKSMWTIWDPCWKDHWECQDHMFGMRCMLASKTRFSKRILEFTSGRSLDSFQPSIVCRHSCHKWMR